MDPSDARWSNLAEDLESLADAQDAAETDAIVAELTRAEHATIQFADRLRAATGVSVVVDLAAGEPVRGVIREAAEKWLLLDGARRGVEWHLIPLSAIDGISGPESGSAPAARLELPITTRLRELQRDRRVVLVRTRAQEYRGRIDRVGSDHLDLEASGGSRGERRVVPIAAILCVSHALPGMEC